MFGYIRPQKSELLVREFSEYGAVYCSLCRRLGRDYGPAARLALNYDAAFYALLLLTCSGCEKPCMTRKRCVVNPLKKCRFCGESGSEFSRAAALTMILSYWKAKDDAADSGFFRRLLPLFLLLFLRTARRKASRRYPELDSAVASAIERQRELENSGESSLDLCAEPTACMMAALFLTAAGSGEENSPKARVLREVGYCLGRWTYLIDAADDLEKDIRRKSFNPFAVKFGLSRKSGPEELKQAKDYAVQVLNGTHAKLTEAAELLEPGCFSPILRNILYLGLPAMQKERLSGKDGDGHVGSL